MSIMELILRSQKRRERDVRKKVLAGIMLGAAAGLAAGLLIAPKSGKRTREELANAARQFPGKARELVELSKDRFDEIKIKLQENRQHARAEAAAGKGPDQ